MTTPFVCEFRARWADMDFNQHMRNAAFLGCAEETRMRYLDANGWSMEQFMKARLGPVVLEDHLVYKKELRLLESFRVELSVGAATDDRRRMRLRNRFFKTDGALCASVESIVLWFDLDARRPTVPPPLLKQVIDAMHFDDDFQRIDS